MTSQERAGILITRYLCEVSRHLPRKQRADVTKELRGLLEDAVEERAAAAGRPPDEELAAEVLRAFGKPDNVAERYWAGPRHLIGPELFAAYRVTVQIILWVLAILFVAGIGLSAAFVPERMQERLGITTIWSWVEHYVKAAFVNVALATLIFAVVERLRLRRAAGAAAKEETWNPADLPELEERDRISIAGRVVSVYLIVAFFVVFNFFPQYFGLVFITDAEIRAISAFAMGFQIPAVLLNLWWFCALALNMALLREGRWRRELRWAEFGLGIFGGLILYLILTGSDFSTINTEWFAQQGWAEAAEAGQRTREALTKLGRLLHGILTIFFIIVIIETGFRFYRLLASYRATT